MSVLFEFADTCFNQAPEIHSGGAGVRTQLSVDEAARALCRMTASWATTRGGDFRGLERRLKSLSILGSCLHGESLKPCQEAKRNPQHEKIKKQTHRDEARERSTKHVFVHLCAAVLL